MKITTNNKIFNLKRNRHNLRVCSQTLTTVLQSQQFLLRKTFLCELDIIFLRFAKFHWNLSMILYAIRRCCGTLIPQLVFK